MKDPSLPALPPAIVTFSCDECRRRFTHPYGYAMHRPCGPVRAELEGAA